jgi:hypothetical protein
VSLVRWGLEATGVALVGLAGWWVYEPLTPFVIGLYILVVANTAYRR